MNHCVIVCTPPFFFQIRSGHFGCDKTNKRKTQIVFLKNEKDRNSAFFIYSVQHLFIFDAFWYDRGVKDLLTFYMSDKKKIMIVEDEDSLRRILADFLKRETDWEIYEAQDGEDALALIKKHLPDMVVLDIAMPKMDGITLAKKMSEETLTEKIKILFLTNSGDLSSVSSASFSPSVVGYLVKSNIDMQEVMDRIKESVE